MNASQKLVRLLGHRRLVARLAKRDIAARYRGTVAGMSWSIITPALTLLVFTFVFSSLFQPRWGTGTASKAEFALLLFPGLLMHGFFADCLVRSTGLVVANPNFVRKIVFPIEVMPLVSTVVSLFHLLLGFVVLLAFQVVILGAIPWTAIWLPLILLPLFMATTGLSWLLASLGVYLRDLPQIVAPLTMLLMFVSPVIYPLEALPENVRSWAFLSPLTWPIESARRVLFQGLSPEPMAAAIFLVLALLMFAAGLTAFERLRSGFADVL